MAAGCIVLATTATARGVGLSDWATSGHAAARLVAAGPDGPGPRLAGIEIRLDPGYITYWRNPGDAGLPPTVATEGSENVAAIAVDFPAPARLDEDGIEAFGYAGGVTLPLRVTLAEAGRPATLAVTLDYAICARLCLPAKASMRLPLPETTAPEATALLAAALRAVPRLSGLGAPGTPSIAAVTAGASAKDPALSVTARADPSAALFVEAPEGWSVQAGAPVAVAAGEMRFPLAVLQRPSGNAPGPIDLRLTLVDPAGAIETTAHVDVPADKP